jgi:hypothetical protein
LADLRRPKVDRLDGSPLEVATVSRGQHEALRQRDGGNRASCNTEVLLNDLSSSPWRQHPLGGALSADQVADQVADVMAWLLGNVGEGAARLTGQVIAVAVGFTSVRPLVKWR